MDKKTSDFSHVVTVVARASDSLQLVGDTLDTALKSSGIAAFGPVRLLSGAGHFTAIEQAADVTDPTALRAALAQAFAGRSDVCVSPAQNRRKRLLVCDMDSTIIGQECLDELADFAGLKPEIAAITERAMRGELDFESALRERVQMLKGLDTSALQQCYRERITLQAGAKTLIASMKAEGARCVLVSGGFTYFTSRVAEAADFDTHHGNTLVDDGISLTGEVAEPILGREAKLQTLLEAAAEHGLSAADALAMGDGANDLAMIEAAGLGIAYRAKPVVAEAAHCAIAVTDLTAALYFQGYSDSEIVWKH